MSRLSSALLALLVLSLVIAASAAPSAAQSGDPAAIVQYFVDQGVLVQFRGMLAATDRGETIDLTGFDNQTTWKRGLGVTPYSDIVLGGTITWQTGASDDACGFVFRQTDDDNYGMVGISQDGRVRLTTVNDGAVLDERIDATSAIRTGDDDTNELVIVAQKEDITIMINGAIMGDTRTAPYTTGKVGEAMTTFARAEQTACRFDNVWLWDLGGAPPIPTPTPAPGKRIPSDSVLAYDAGMPAIIADLELMGKIPAGGRRVAQESRVTITYANAAYYPLMVLTPHTNLVMGGLIDITVLDDWAAHCTLVARADLDSGDTIPVTSLRVGIGKNSVKYYDYNSGELNNYQSNTVFDIYEAPHYILLTVVDDTLNVWLDGKRTFYDVDVIPHSGTLGLLRNANYDSTRCSFRDVWVWTLDDVTAP